MITLNLLPDIKKEYLKANRTKNMFIMGAFLVSAVSITIVVLMAMFVLGVQKLQISNSQSSIDKSIETLAGTEDLAKIITIQNQLETLPSLHEGKIATSRLFDYLQTVTPNEVRLNRVSVDFEGQTVGIRGEGDDFKSVNTFVDTLKNASYTHANNSEASVAFSSVVLGSISAEGVASFRVTFEYAPDIFDVNIEGLKLSVPNITSTRSQTEKPKSLFEIEEVQP